MGYLFVALRLCNLAFVKLLSLGAKGLFQIHGGLSKTTTIGALHAEKMDEAALLYVSKLTSPASNFWDKLFVYKVLCTVFRERGVDTFLSQNPSRHPN